ncbi:MAG: S8 family peptidase [Pseudobdellovibrionaceae bacterium]
MQKFLSILTLNFVFSISAHATLTSAVSSKDIPTNDTLVGYQWAIYNNGQTVTSDLDDIHPKIQKIKPGVGIFWKNFDSLMKKDSIVAVIDSGVDTAHPDIKNHLVLPGYNFVTKDPRAKNLVDDDVGHGTHISGIIAAESNNGVGISGLSNRIKILPLKVYDSHEQSFGGPEKTPLSERVALAVEYAVQQKADIILLSLGWPRALNSEKVQTAFRKALESNILIVAAAGNDHHDAHIFPCSFTGVICVGASDVEGALADFSNFGGHVDLLAPGQEILSLWPLTKLSERFGPKGYELKSGTSQAAPMVAGALGILRGIYPDSSSDELRRRLFASGTGDNNNSTFGHLNIEKAIQYDLKDFSAPVFKEVESVTVDPSTHEFKLPVVIESTEISLPNPAIESSSEFINFDNVEFLKSVGTNYYFEVKGHLSNLQTDSQLHYKIKLGQKSYYNTIRITINLNSKISNKFVLNKDASFEKLGLQSVPQLGFENEHYFWGYESSKDKLRIHLIKPQAAIEHKILDLPGVTKPQPGFGLLAGNWLLDNKTSFLLGALETDKDGNPKSVHYFYLNDQLEIKFHFILNYEGVVPTYSTPSDISVTKKQLPSGQNILVPVFWDTGLIPKKDADPNPLHFQVNVNDTRLFYLEPQANNNLFQFNTRCFCSNWIQDNVKRQANLNYSETISVIAMLKQSNQDLQTGAVKLFISAGKGIQNKNFVLSIKDKQTILTPIENSTFDLSHQFAQEGWTTNYLGLNTETVFQGIFSPIAGRSVHFQQNGKNNFSATSLNLPQRGEDIIGVIKSFSNNTEQISFFETTSSIRAQGTWNGHQIDSKANLYRSSFLPGKMYSQLLIPVMTSGADKSPAMIFDGSGLFANLISVYRLSQNGVLTTHVEDTLEVPANCSMRNPEANQTGQFKMWFLCNEKDSLVFESVDL